MITFSPETIPGELKRLTQHIVWDYELRDGKPTKVPYSPRRRHRASATEPRTWGTFEQACATMEERMLPGVGFMFTKSDGLFGVDLDDCINDTGDITPEAFAIVQAFDTYTEITPSGRGLHIIGRGSIPGERRRSGKIEMYDSERFFTMTGNVLEGYGTIQDCQDALNGLYSTTFPPKDPTPIRPAQHATSLSLDDQTIIDAAHRLNPKFPALWSGDTSAYSRPDNAGHSEARSALIYLLAGYTKVPTQLERLFQASALFRPDKWPRERDRLIGDALRDVTWQYEPPASHAESRGGARPSPSTAQTERSMKDRNTHANGTPMEAGIPHGRTQPSGDGCLVELARIAELEQLLAAERELRIAAEQRHSNVMQVIDNPTYNATQAVATIRALFEYERQAFIGKVDDDGCTTIYLGELEKGTWIDSETGERYANEPKEKEVRERCEKQVTMARSTISKALKDVAARTAAFTIGETKDPATGKTRLTMQVPSSDTQRAFAAVSETFVRVDRSRGKHKPNDPRLANVEPCKTCGLDADVVIRTDVICADCSTILSTTNETIAAPFQNETISDSPHVEDVLKTRKTKRSPSRRHRPPTDADVQGYVHRDYEVSSPASSQTETVSSQQLCGACRRPLGNAEEGAAGCHSYDCQAPFDIQRPPPRDVPLYAMGDD